MYGSTVLYTDLQIDLRINPHLKRENLISISHRVGRLVRRLVTEYKNEAFQRWWQPVTLRRATNVVYTVLALFKGQKIQKNDALSTATPSTAEIDQRICL